MKGKTLLSLLLFLISGIEGMAQNVSCDTCKIDCLCEHYFGELRQDQSKISAITNNWNDFFGSDLEGIFPAPQHVRTVSIKFDGMGSIYPENSDPIRAIKDDFLDPKLNYKQFHQSTFYHVFNKNKDIPSSARSSAVTTLINSTMPISSFNLDRGQIDYFDFVKKWNEKFIGAKINEINDKLKSGEIKKVIFFIHGFNVPYSLAQVQGNVLLDSVLSLNKNLKPENILFVRVFWPSGDFKRNNIGPNKCSYKNRIVPKTAFAFTYFSNRAYMAGIYLRRILAKMSHPDIPVDIITHSHGATVATTSLINTITKMQKGCISTSIALTMVNEPLATRRISLFLNAPSIPGANTFVDLENDTTQQRYYFFVGYNDNDKTLLKGFLPFIRPAAYLGSTTLGCNRNCEVASTKLMFLNKKMGNNFSSAANSTNMEHDFFCYMQQKEFNVNLKSFLQR